MKTLTQHPDTTPNKLSPQARHRLLLTADEFTFQAQCYKADPKLRHVAVFLLRQAAEITLSLPGIVRQSVHEPVNMAALVETPECLCAGMADCFARNTDEEKRLLNTLLAATDVSRCHAWPALSEEEIDQLQGYVCTLKDRAEKATKTRRKPKLELVVRPLIKKTFEEVLLEGMPPVRSAGPDCLRQSFSDGAQVV